MVQDHFKMKLLSYMCIFTLFSNFFLYDPFFGYASVRGYLSIDVDVSNLEINQCDNESYPTKNHNNTSENKWTSATTSSNEFDLFYGSHKCHRMSMQVKWFDFFSTKRKTILGFLR